ncbi:response regulator [Paraburkholderia sp. BL10I2N1]|uniref:response regulator n=1 Tax=Paraburkholderia sp. BL10I2N1 TaxID=1938796 RepID=UPI0010DCE425|nr:PAS domain S-box-containing protein [Paraburkholderia sp. BL10I2N1]
MNIPTQDQANVVTEVVSTFGWFTNSWPARPGEHYPVSATLAGYPWSGRRPEGATLHPGADGLKPLLDMVPSAVIVIDKALRVVLVNERAVALFGYTSKELGGMSFAQLFPRMADNDAKDRSGPFAPGAPCDGLADSGELRTAIARCKDGGERAVSMKCTRYAPDDASLWIVMMMVDPCEQEKARHADLQRAHLASLSELGEMAAVLAYEVNQPLTAILSNAQSAQRFLESTPSDLSDLREALADIVADGWRATEIVRKLRHFVKRGTPETLPLDLGNLVRGVMHLLRRDAVMRGVRVTLDVARNVPTVRGDNIQLQQVMINLLLNAFDAIEGCRAEDRLVSVKISAAPQGEGVKITVSDRGPGLIADQISEVFKPFTTSKPQGLGLGLPISRSIVSMHHGRLWAESNSDRGATFHVLLPSASAAEGSGHAPDPVSGPASVVFVVDDDEHVRIALGRLIRSAGYRVETFDSAEAFIARADLEGHPACLLLDLQLPGLSGLALQRQLHEWLPIIFMSGHSDLNSAVDAMKAGATDFLPKPVSESVLLDVLEQALERARQMFESRAKRADIQNRLDHLTPREREVMTLVVAGYLNKQVASELGAAEKTIKIHRARVMEKMKAGSLAELVRLAEKADFAPTKGAGQ